MYQSERVFIKKFLAALYKNNIEKIPYDNLQFYAGIACMESKFNQLKPTLGEYKDEIGMLFIRNPIDGVFDEFKSGISSQNGLLLTFDNPDFVNAVIKMDDNDSEYILSRGDIGINNDVMASFAKSFCEGAKLESAAPS